MSMYAKGMPTGDIEAHIRDIYGLEVADATVSRSFLWRKSGSSACHSAALSYVFSMSLLYDKRAVISTVTAFFALDGTIDLPRRCSNPFSLISTASPVWSAGHGYLPLYTRRFPWRKLCPSHSMYCRQSDCLSGEKRYAYGHRLPCLSLSVGRASQNWQTGCGLSA